MRTTLDINEDVVRVVRHIASEQNQSVGKVISALARLGPQPKRQPRAEPSVIPLLARNAGAQSVTSQIVKDLLEQEH